MRNSFRSLVILSAAIVSCLAHAESASDQVTKLEAETLVLKAREKQLEVQASILAKQNEILLKQAASDRMMQSEAVGEPIVRSIEGIGKSLYATLQLPNGGLVDVQVGDVLAGGMRVVAIHSSEVVVERNKRRIHLSTASQVAPQFNPNYPAVGLSLPPPLPIMLHREPGR